MSGLGRLGGAFVWLVSGVVALGLNGALVYAALNVLPTGFLPISLRTTMIAGLADDTGKIVFDTRHPKPPPPPPPPDRSATGLPAAVLESIAASRRAAAKRDTAGQPAPDVANASADAGVAEGLDQPAAPSSSDAVLKIAIDAIRNHVGGDCFAAVPAINAAGELEVTILDRGDGGADALTVSLAEATGQMIAVREQKVTEAQCPALAFLSRAFDYPEGGMILTLAKPELTSGDALAGRITGAKAGSRLHLMLIDDAGLVQRLDPFMKAAPGGAGFSIALRLEGQAVSSSQLVVAVAVPSSLPSLTGLKAEKASTLFLRVALEFSAAGAGGDIAVAPFSLR